MHWQKPWRNGMNLNAKNLLLDTNVLLDVILQRKPFEQHSLEVFRQCIFQKHKGIIAAHSITNMFYILRKYFSPEDLRSLLLKLTEQFEIAGIDKKKLAHGLQNINFSDFEDSLQDFCAEEWCADYIITRNTKDFACSSVPAITPEEFLKMI